MLSIISAASSGFGPLAVTPTPVVQPVVRSQPLVMDASMGRRAAFLGLAVGVLCTVLVRFAVKRGWGKGPLQMARMA